MPQTFHVTDARIVLADRVMTGSLEIRDGRIAAMDEGTAAPAGALDLEGDLLLPGLVEIHTDHLEKHLSPRVGVDWPALPALLAHDAQVAAAGITTVLDALCIGQGPGRDWLSIAREAIPTLHAATRDGHLRAEHFLHLRCELPDPELPDLFAAYSADPRVRLVSLMDHTPGQRQFADIARFMQGQSRHGATEAEVMQTIAETRDRQDRFAEANRRHLMECCRTLGLPVASHDDETEAHVADAHALGIAISEFPTTLTAAAAAKRLGLQTVMGAPNVVRGKSHSGNVAALDLARRGLLDMLSSDYAPVSLLHAAFRLVEDGGMDLPAAIACVSRTPARAVGLDDRGEIAVGLSADLVRVRPTPQRPVVRAVWRRGERTA